MGFATPEDLKLMRRGKVLVMTNGVFDVLHAGHVTYLTKARALGDLLVVGLNSDASARSLGKGPGRPVNTLEDRAAVLSALRCVDAVVPFEETTAEEVVRLVRPDVYVKGGDYEGKRVPEAEIVEAYGGRVKLIPFLPGRSTTETLKRLGLE